MEDHPSQAMTSLSTVQLDQDTPPVGLMVQVSQQIQCLLLVPGSDPKMAQDALGKAIQYTSIELVGYADTASFSATTNGTVQTTGPGKVLGLSPTYKTKFSSELRLLLGSVDGVLVARHRYERFSRQWRSQLCLAPASAGSCLRNSGSCS